MATKPIAPSTTRTVSISDTKTSLDTIASNVDTGEDVILERDGSPTAAVISMEDYRQLLAMREKARRAELMEQFRALTKEISEQNADLSAADIDEIAQQCSRELREERYQDAQRRLRTVPSTDNRCP